MSRYYAHSVSQTPIDRWQGLKEHLEAVAAGARLRLEKFDAGSWGQAAGLLHDLGKYSGEFQALLSGDVARVDHSSAGAQVARKHYGVAGNLIAACVAGHHAGLANGSGTGKRLPLAMRLDSIVPDYSAWQGEFELPALKMPRLAPHPTAATERVGLQLATFSRMIFSALIDADWSDTGAFYNGPPIVTDKPSPASFQSSLNGYLDALQEAAATTRLNVIRVNIRATARERAGLPQGVFSMSVPTGGGKTLAALAFALDHAVKHCLDRVIYVAPYCAIIDQTADVFRRALQPYQDSVVEHHSGFREPRTRGERQTAEAWGGPIIVTTAVQFFESLFSDRPSRCRKLHNIGRSVVILDEAQIIPTHLLRPCVAILDELARNYAVSIVLCTATQPALIERPKTPARSFAGGLVNVRELAPAPSILYRRLRRVTIRCVGPLTDAVVAEGLASQVHSLAIVNTRPHARALFGLLRDAEGSAHLSTMMCPAHRRQRLADIRQRLSDGLPVRLVSTSLIEAGVDLDFRAVWRAMAGLDQIAQAAGRCNREGRRKASRSVVTVFEAEHPEPHYLRAAANATREVLRQHADPLALRTLEAYFRRLYWSRQVGGDGLDDRAILPRLNARATDLLFPHEDVALDMTMIEDEGETVLIPWNAEARRLIGALSTSENLGMLARQLQPYVVSIYAGDFDRLKAAGAIAPATDDDQFWKLIDVDRYRDDWGLITETGAD